MTPRTVVWLVALITCSTLALAQNPTVLKPATTAPPPSAASTVLAPPQLTAIPLTTALARQLIQPRDTLRLFCWDVDGLLVNAVLPIGADGQIRPPGVPPLPALNVSLGEVQAALVAAYSPLYPEATLLLSLDDPRNSTASVTSGLIPDTIQKPLAAGEQLAIRCWVGEVTHLDVVVTISSDLKLALPPLGAVPVQSETLTSLRDRLQLRYRTYYPGCSLSVLRVKTTELAQPPLPPTEPAEITTVFPPTLSAGEILKALPRFGLKVFSTPVGQPVTTLSSPEATGNTSNLPVPADYLVGPGDKLAVRAWSGAVEHFSVEVVVSPEGRVYLPTLGDLPVAGQTLDQVTSAVSGRTEKLYRNCQVTVVLSQIRTVDVYVTGEAVAPGRYTLTGTATVFTALYAAGGPTPSGSLRDIRLIRKNEAPKVIDLYPYLLTGDRTGDDPLLPGDTIFISPLGATIGISGLVRRPALYEISTPLDCAAALEMAGGLDTRGYGRNVEVWRVEGNTAWTVSNVDLALPAAEAKGPAFSLRSGDLVLVRPVLDQPANTVTISGAVRRPGEYEVPVEGLDVKGLIMRAEGPSDAAYMQSAAIWRLTPNNEPRLLRLNLLRAQEGEPGDNLALTPGDRLHVYSREEVMQSQEVSITGAVAAPGIFPWAADMRVSDLLMLGRGLIDGAYVGHANLRRLTPQFTREIIGVDLAQVLGGNLDADLALQPGDQLTVYLQSEMSVAAEVVIWGAVLRPGTYPRTAGMKASDLITQAGGLVPEAGDEVTLAKGRIAGSAQTITLQITQREGEQLVLDPDPVLADDDSLTVVGRGDFRIRAQIATIQGQVAKPGTYPLTGTTDQPDTVYKLLQRAGDLLPDGNPRGIVLYRLQESLLGSEQISDMSLILDSFNRERSTSDTTLPAPARAGSLQASVANQLSSVLTGQEGMAIVTPQRRLSAELWVRAIPVDGQKLITSKGLEGDIPLMPGDTLVVPSTPTTVAVIGAVVRPGAMPYEGLKRAWDYVIAAGGPMQDAARNRIVIIRANGSVSPPQHTREVHPGDVVVVPSVVTVRSISAETGGQRLLRTLAAVALGFMIF